MQKLRTLPLRDYTYEYFTTLYQKTASAEDAVWGGVQYIKERIQEEVLTGYTVPCGAGKGIVLEGNQRLVQIAV